MRKLKSYSTLAELEQHIRTDAALRDLVRTSEAIRNGIAKDVLEICPAAQREFRSSADPLGVCAAYLRLLAMEAEAPAPALRTAAPAGDPLAALLARASIDPAVRAELLCPAGSQHHAERLLADSTDLQHEFRGSVAVLAAFLRGEARTNREPATAGARLTAFAHGRAVWALEPGAHRLLMRGLLDRAAAGGAPSAAASSRAPRGSSMRVEKGVAIVPIKGVITHHASPLDDWFPSAGTTVDQIRADLRAALSREDVKSIVLDIDSPGGNVSGLDELAAEIREARTRKPITASTETMMASAAYYLGSQASRVVATRSAQVGSIGVIASVLDDSRRMQNIGVDPIVVKSVAAKGGLQSDGSIGDHERAEIQREVDAYHGMFVEAIAAGRGIDEAKAKALADGKLYLGAEAQQRGLIDAVQPLSALLAS